MNEKRKMRIKMKKLLSIAAVFLMFFVGCSKDVNINGPVNDQLTEQFVTREVQEGLNVNTTFTVSKIIDGSKGGSMFIGDYLSAKNGKQDYVYASLTFPAGAFSGTKTITMTLDNKTLTGTFSPSMTFSKSASFSALYGGVNLSSSTQSQYTFVYYSPSGVKYSISSSYIYFDKTNGVLGILNAQLPHFSRYGFVRRTY
jgi:hypothetical protein